MSSISPLYHLLFLQYEMALVNKADSDRDTIDEYMAELDALHRKQLGMIQSVEEVSRLRTSYRYSCSTY